MRLPRRSEVFFLFCAVAAVPVATPSVVHAQDRVARMHFESGRSYYEQGRYQDALREFEEAYRLASDERKPLMLFNIGQTQERLGRLDDAIESFQRYVAAYPRAEDRTTVEERIRNLQTRLSGTGIALTVNEEGAHVLVDGVERGATPLPGPLRTTPGSHEIKVEKEGFRTFTLRVTVPAGERVAAEASLVPVADGEEEEEEEEGESDGGTTTTGTTGGTTRSSRRGQGGGGGLGPLPWIVGGVAVAAAIAGGVLGIMAIGESDGANDEAFGDEGTYEAKKLNARDLALGADIAFGIAVVAGGAAVVLFILDAGSGEESAAAGPVPIVLNGGAGMALAGSF